MKTTEYKYWINGYRKYGGKFHTYAISIHFFALMLCWGINKPEIIFYKLK